MKKPYVKSNFEGFPLEPPDTLVEEFYHNKQNRADKRQQKWLKKRDHDDYDDYDRDYDT